MTATGSETRATESATSPRPEVPLVPRAAAGSRPEVPRRFRGDPQRTRRLARPLFIAARDRSVDEGSPKDR